MHSPYHRDKWRKPQNPPNQEHHPMGAQAPQVHPPYNRGQGAQAPKPTQSGAPSHGGASPKCTPLTIGGKGRKPPKKRVEGAQHPPNIPPPHRGGGRGWGQLQEHYPQKKNLKNIPPKKFLLSIIFFKNPLTK
ncbi:MAG: hypothetical protein E7502_03570 [Ruminococcus sp.]|nr:hypothetical protein [Ruminococcus sp.]